MFKKAALICFAILFFATALWANLAHADDDLPDYSGWVNDFSGTLSSEYKDKISSLIEKVEKSTSAEIAVCVIDSLRYYDDATYANLLFEKWKIGKKGKDNGVLLLLAVKERKVRIETGYGVEGILPDGLCGEILDSYVIPYLRKGDYGEGLYRGVVAISNVIEGKYDGISKASKGESKPFIRHAILYIVAGLWIIGSGNWAIGVTILLIVTSVILFFFKLFAWFTISILFLFIWFFWVNRFLRDHGIPTRGRRIGGHSYGSFGGGGFSGGFGGFGGGFSGGGGAGRRF